MIRIFAATQSTSRIIARRRCSVPISVVRSLLHSFALFSNRYWSLGLSSNLFPLAAGCSSAGVISSSISFRIFSDSSPWSETKQANTASQVVRIFSDSTPLFASTCPATPVYSSLNARSKCSVPIYGCFISLAALAAYLSACCAGFVYEICIYVSLMSFYFSATGSRAAHIRQKSHLPAHEPPAVRCSCNALAQVRSLTALSSLRAAEVYLHQPRSLRLCVYPD